MLHGMAEFLVPYSTSEGLHATYVISETYVRTVRMRYFTVR